MPLNKDRLQEISQMFRVAAQKNSFALLRVLKAGPLSINALAMRTGIKQPAVSKHMTAMKYVGLVVSERRGQRTIYAIHASLLDNFIKTL